MRDKSNAPYSPPSNTNQLQTVFETIPLYVAMLDIHGRITLANPIAISAMKRSKVEVVGLLFWDSPWWTEIPEVRQQIKTVIARAARGERQTLDIPYHLEANGQVQPRWLELSMTPVVGANGLVTAITATGCDITERVTRGEKVGESEAHFRHLVDSSPAILWLTDTQAKCTYLSRQWYELTGRTPEDDLGFGWVENVHPEDREKAAKAFFSALEARGKISIRYRLRHKSGEYRWAVDSGLPRLDPDGRFVGYVGTVIDVHDQVTSEGELRDLETRFERSASATNLGVWYCDLPFAELNWNKETKEHFFMAPGERVTIAKFYEYIHPDDRETTAKAIQYSIDNHTTYDIHYRTINPKDPNQFKWIRAIGWTDYDKDGLPIRFDGITLDVTKEHRRELEFKAAKEEAERANQLKSTFLANMSHEIRTPLAAILGFADLLRDSTLSHADRARYADIITLNGEQLSSLINDILDLSKVEAGFLTLELSEVNPIEIATEVISLLRIKASEKSLSFEFHADSSTPASVTTDPIRLRQILTNIIGNAIKFTRSGFVRIRCHGVQNDQGQFVHFEVSDSGIGIPENERERIFDAFVQGDGTLSKKFSGTGLGLALSRRLTRSLGGDISLIRSLEGQGSTFSFSILNQQARGTIVTAKKPALPQLSTQSLEGLKVLTVDDSPDNREIIGQFLTKAGARVELAEDGREACDKALSEDFDLVLMDIQMPEMDGYTATNHLREAGYQKPIIALTAHAMIDVRSKCLEAGCTDHLAKPIKRKDLLEMIVRYARPTDIQLSISHA